MGQIYSDDTRESEPQALPNVEVFAVSQLEINYNMANLDHVDACTIIKPGWYWCPATMDSEPFGPFVTEADAIADAQIGVAEHFRQIEDAIDALVGLLIGYPPRQPWGAWESNQWASLMGIGQQVRAAKACYKARDRNSEED